ncbi:hypothetical protein MBLNU230_g4130t1 [Neophaeotheca triangularis]
MAKQPAVVIIARHGPRLDAADPQWHLATPTPYDPPLTYGGWTQCRTLGGRIASLLDAREQAVDATSGEPHPTNGVTTHDFAGTNGGGTRKRKRKHKVVIHSSPFLRCLQTSVAIAAGMAQHQPSNETGHKPSVGHRTPTQLHSASPKVKAMEGNGSPTLAPISEPKHDFAHDLARKHLTERKKYRRAKLRVDAFLGEWLNPQYFEHITHPPPSSMMVTAAKAELMQNEPIDVFTPSISTTRTPSSSLWGGVNGASKSAGTSRQGTLDNFSHLRLDDALHVPTARSRASSEVSANSSLDVPHRPKSPYRPGHLNMAQNSTFPNSETSQYIAPTPSWAVSPSDVIPRGYVSHARQSCTNVDFQWDSSRAPQAWGDGGDYGEEWSSMHRRFRRGLNHVVDWYSRHDADDRGEDALGFDQAERNEDDEEEELVVVLVTHGAGCNALIGAMTGQPVLLDVGMASLTMAVRKDDAPPVKRADELLTQKTDASASSLNGYRHESIDTGLSSVYDMKLVASSEHLRSNADARKPSAPPNTSYRDSLPRFREIPDHAPNTSPLPQNWRFGEPTPRNSGSTSAALGSMRRPSTSNGTAPPLNKANTAQGLPHHNVNASLAPPGATGLWTPPIAQTPSPSLSAFHTTSSPFFHPLNADHDSGHSSPGQDLVLDFSNSPPPEPQQPTIPNGTTTTATNINPKEPHSSHPLNLATALSRAQSHFQSQPPSHTPSRETEEEKNEEEETLQETSDSLTELPPPGGELPQALKRGLSQKGLWGARPSGDLVSHPAGIGGPKRRWTLDQGRDQGRGE